ALLLHHPFALVDRERHRDGAEQRQQGQDQRGDLPRPLHAGELHQQRQGGASGSTEGQPARGQQVEAVLVFHGLHKVACWKSKSSACSARCTRLPWMKSMPPIHRAAAACGSSTAWPITCRPSRCARSITSRISSRSSGGNGWWAKSAACRR